MNASNNPQVIKTIEAMAEMYGKTFSTAAAHMYLDDLNGFTSDQILSALTIARRTLKYFPTIADVVQIITATDGRPSAEEAWALCPKSETDSAVWTDEISQAFSVASPLLWEGDKIGARMAFKEKYESLLKSARSVGKPVKWWATLGYDKRGREAALIEAVDKKRISIEAAQAHMPELEFKSQPARIAGPNSPDADAIKQLIHETMKDLE